MREPAKTFDEVPAVTGNAHSRYVQVFDQNEMRMYDKKTTDILITNKPVASAYRTENLYRMPIKSCPKKETARTQSSTHDEMPELVYNDDSSNDKSDDEEEDEIAISIAIPPVEEAIANAYELKTQPELATYYHAMAGFPTKSEWLQGWDCGSYQSWKGLTRKMIIDFYPSESDKTLKGHMRKKRAGLQSTKVREEVLNEIKEEASSGDHTTNEGGMIFTKVFNLRDKVQRTIFTDQTGKFPVKSYRGYQYVMLLYDSQSNAILVEPMRD